MLNSQAKVTAKVGSYMSAILASSPQFTSSTGTGKIYVPASLVDTYKADSVWGVYASKIVAMS